MINRYLRWSLAATAATAGLLWVFDTRRRVNRWGASDAETTTPLPGDELVPHPRLGYTRAISIGAAPDSVWPWIIQMGHARGGLYSYDWLENLVGCDLHSVTQVLPQFQHVEVGSRIDMGPEGYPSFEVAHVDPPHSLVLVGVDPRRPNDAVKSGVATSNVMSTWQWVLRPEGKGTRLLVRQRLTFTTTQAAMWLAIEPIGFIMENKMLRGIKERAQRKVTLSASTGSQVGCRLKSGRTLGPWPARRTTMQKSLWTYGVGASTTEMTTQETRSAAWSPTSPTTRESSPSSASMMGRRACTPTMVGGSLALVSTSMSPR